MNWSSIIDGFDTVVRYGKCRQLGTTAGVKTDYVFLQWTRSCIEEEQHNADKLRILKEQRPLVGLIRTPKHPDELRLWMSAHTVFDCCPLMVLPHEPRERAAARLAECGARKPYRPSSGTWVHEYMKPMLPPDVQIYTLGFGFYGSDHHDWEAERKYWQSEYDTGRVRRLEAEV